MAIHSKDTVVKLDTSVGVLTDISAYCDKVELPEELDVQEVTVFGSAYRQWMPGFSDSDGSIGGPWTRASDAFFAPIMAGFSASTLASVTIEYAPEGTAASDRKITGEVILKNYKVSSDINSPVTWSADVKVTNGLTRTTY
jgi:hypothetical protein